jgi:hypothetical protein
MSSNREQSGVSPTRSLRLSRNWIPSRNSRRQPSWASSWRLGSRNRFSPTRRYQRAAPLPTLAPPSCIRAQDSRFGDVRSGPVAIPLATARGRGGNGSPCAMKESTDVILKSYPFEDSFEVESAAHFPRQAVQRPLSVFLPVTKIRSRREFVEAPCCPKKFVAKRILIK